MLRLWIRLFATLVTLVAASTALILIIAPALPSDGVISYTLGYRYDLVLVDARSSIQVQPLGYSVNGGVSWSPDGRYLAFNRPRLSRGFLLDFAAGTIDRIEEPGLYVSAFRWKPDQRTVTYPHADTLFAYDILTRTLTELMPLPNNPPFAWLPDGERIVYPAGQPTFGVWVQDVQTGTRRRVTEATWSDGGFTALPVEVSPDGCCIPYTYFDAGGRIFGVLDVENGDSRALFISRQSEVFIMPVWSPDGAQLAVIRDQFAHPDTHIDIVDRRTGRTRRLLTTDRTIGTLDWLPRTYSPYRQ